MHPIFFLEEFIMKKIISNLIKQFSSRSELIENLEEFETVIGHKFKNTSLINAALSHTSLMKNNDNYWPFERMEFLGDSILGLVVAEELFNIYPEYSEGDLSKLKSKLVSRKYLSFKAREFNLGKFVRMSNEAEQSNGRDSSTILCDTMEAIICAIYLDANHRAAAKFIKRIILNDFHQAITLSKVTNYKSILQEFSQSEFHDVPIYKIIKEIGPDHDKVFTIQVLVNHLIVGSGKGPNKKSAEQEAAKAACIKYELLKKK